MASTNHVLTVTDDSTERTYTDVIPIDGKAGYVEIIDHFYGAYHKFLPTELKENITYKTVTIKRHSQNTVVIEAKLDNKIALIVDPSYPGSQQSCNDGHVKFGWAWKPWNTDVIAQFADKFKFIRQNSCVAEIVLRSIFMNLLHLQSLFQLIVISRLTQKIHQ